MKVSKTEIVMALATEPLAAGNWISNTNETLEDCSACALGAVVRSSFFKDKPIKEV